MTIYKQVNSPAAAVEDVKVFMDRSVSAGRCRCRPPPSGERLTLGTEDGGSDCGGKLEAAASECIHLSGNVHVYTVHTVHITSLSTSPDLKLRSQLLLWETLSKQ